MSVHAIVTLAPHRRALWRASLSLLTLLVILCCASGTASISMAAPGAAIDLNTADAATLARGLLGIGDSRARAIIEHRRRHGPFRSVDELALVKGIGPKTVERNRGRLRVTGVEGAAAAGAASPRTRSNAGAVAPRVRAARGPSGDEPIIMEGLPRDGG